MVYVFKSYLTTDDSNLDELTKVYGEYIKIDIKDYPHDEDKLLTHSSRLTLSKDKEDKTIVVREYTLLDELLDPPPRPPVTNEDIQEIVNGMSETQIIQLLSTTDIFETIDENNMITLMAITDLYEKLESDK